MIIIIYYFMKILRITKKKDTYILIFLYDKLLHDVGKDIGMWKKECLIIIAFSLGINDR